MSINVTVIEHEGPSVLSNEQFLVVLQIYGILQTIMSLVGITANTINIHVFFKMGMVDGVTLSFQVLATSDLCFVLIQLMLGVCSFMDVLSRKNIVRLYIDPFAVLIFAANLGIMLYLLSTLITTFLAVARCMCIVKPLHFKNDFSKTRSSVVLSAFTLCSLGCFIPVFSTTGMTEIFDDVRNASRRVLWLSDIRDDVYGVIQTMVDVVVPVVAQIINAICVIVMAKALHKTHTFRQSISAKSKAKVTRQDSIAKERSSQQNPQLTKSFSEDQSDHIKEKTDSTTGKLSGKELQVVKQVALICTVFIVTNTPKIIAALYALTEPEFALGKKYGNIYLTCSGVRVCTEIINSSVNILVYLSFNSKFREMCPFIKTA